MKKHTASSAAAEGAEVVSAAWEVSAASAGEAAPVRAVLVAWEALVEAADLLILRALVAVWVVSAEVVEKAASEDLVEAAWEASAALLRAPVA